MSAVPVWKLLASPEPPEPKVHLGSRDHGWGLPPCLARHPAYQVLGWDVLACPVFLAPQLGLLKRLAKLPAS